MGINEELLRVAKKLEKITNRKDTSCAAQAVDILKSLQQMKITLEQIQKTRIGLIVNNLRKSIKDDEINSLSKSLIKNWKKLLNENDTKNPSGGDSIGGTNGTPKVSTSESNLSSSSQNDSVVSNSGASARLKTSNGSNVESSTSANSMTSPPSSSGSTPTTTVKKSGGMGLPPPKQTSFPTDTNNTIRLKCRELLANALKLEITEIEINSEESFYDSTNLACLIEDSIFSEFKDTNQKYKNRIRSRVSNLNDKKNPDLKLNVLRGHIKPEKIAVMTAEEMASDEMKQLRQRFTKEAINDAQLSLTGGTKTDLLKCPQCKRNNCTYNQVQTRSADEPMTTFCFCNECGKRWKFC